MDKPGTQDGRKGRLDDQTKGYYRRVEETLSNGFDNAEDDKELFMKNVFTTLTAEAVAVSQNQTVSRIVEELLRHANLDQLLKFSGALSRDWELACTDRFVSHVTQTLITQLGSDLGSGQQSDEVFDVLLELYSYLMEDLAGHMRDTYSSHILRVMLEILGGVRVSEHVTRSRVARHGTESRDKDSTTVLKPNPRLQGLLSDMCDKIISLPDITDHIEDRLSNPVLQTLLLVLHAVDQVKCEEICRTLMEASKMFKISNRSSESKLSSVMQHEIGSHFVEQLLHVATDDTLDDIITTQLSDQFLQMALHPTANFILQKLIKASKTQTQFESIYAALGEHFESVLCMNHNQVIVCLAEGCVQHHTKQVKFLKDLMKAFHCYDPEERQTKCVTLFAALTTYDVFYKLPDEDSDSDEEVEIKFPELSRVSLHGSLLLQQLMSWGNPRLVVTSLLQLKPSELRHLACDPCGSHVIEAFLRSKTIGDKSHDLLYNKLKGQYTDLSCNKNGSRTMDSLFLTAPLRHKYTIAEELSKHESRLRGDRFGRILWFNYKLMYFLRNANAWKQQQASEVKKRQLFQEVIGDDKKGKQHTKDEGDDDVDDSHLRLQVDNDTGQELGQKSTDEAEDVTKGKRKKHKKAKSHELDDETIEEEAVSVKKKKHKKVKDSTSEKDTDIDAESNNEHKNKDNDLTEEEIQTSKKKKHKKAKSQHLDDETIEEEALPVKKKKHKKVKNSSPEKGLEAETEANEKHENVDDDLDDEEMQSSKKKKHKKVKTSHIDIDDGIDIFSRKKNQKRVKSSDVKDDKSDVDASLVEDSTPSKPKKRKKQK